MASEIPEIFAAFGPQLNTFMAVGIVLQYFRGKLLQFKWNKAVWLYEELLYEESSFEKVLTFPL